MKKIIGKEYVAPWEKAFSRVLTPLDEFIHRQTTSGILLMLCAIVALFIANSPWNEAYHRLLEMPFTIGVPEFQLSKSLHHWINDGLMALFFFVIGLELKRELLVGELADPKLAMLPIIAAVGGMVVPVLIYISINPEGHALDGWGVPMATDIAFALGALALLGNRVPQNLLTFLVALAIVDDLGAVMVIALFYTETLNFLALAIAAAMLLLLVALNLGGIRRPLPYILLGVVLWIAMLKSGVHATLAGIFLAFTIPMRPKYDAKRFLSYINEMVGQIRRAYQRCRILMKWLGRLGEPISVKRTCLKMMNCVPGFALWVRGSCWCRRLPKFWNVRCTCHPPILLSLSFLWPMQAFLSTGPRWAVS